MENKLSLAKWLEMQYIEWMKGEGEIKSQREFAEFLGIEPMSLSYYLNGKRRNPDIETVAKIAKALNPEIYDVLGLARPDPQLQFLTKKWHHLDQPTKNRILKIAEKPDQYQT